MSNTKPGLVTSAENVLKVLWMLHDRDNLRVTDVSEALGVAQSTAHRLLAALVNQSMTVRSESRTYRLSPEYLRRCGARPMAQNLADAARSSLEELRDLTGETAHLMILRETNIHIVESVESKHDLRVGSRKNQLWPAHRTAGGRLLLRSLPLESLQRIYHDGLPADSNFGPGEIAEFQRSLLSWREDYTFTVGRTEPGITGVAMGVKDATGYPIAAICVNGPIVRIGRPQVPGIADRMREIVKGLEGRLKVSPEA